MKKLPHESCFKWYTKTSTAGASKLVNRLVSMLTAYHWPDANVFEVQTALVEVVNNALEHGNRHDSSKRLFFSGRLSAAKLLVRIRDEGNGFDYEKMIVPRAELSDPLALRGRGLFLVRNLVSRVSFNQTGNEIILEKSISPPAPFQQ